MALGPDHSDHGIGEFITEINREYQRKYNTTEVIFNEGDSDVTVERENNTVESPPGTYIGGLPTGLETSIAYTATGTVSGLAYVPAGFVVLVDADTANNTVYLNHITDSGSTTQVSYSTTGGFFDVASANDHYLFGQSDTYRLNYASAAGDINSVDTLTTNLPGETYAASYDPESERYVISDHATSGTLEFVEVTDNYNLKSLGTHQTNYQHAGIEAGKGFVGLAAEAGDSVYLDCRDLSNITVKESRSVVSDQVTVVPITENDYATVSNNGYLTHRHYTGSGWEHNSLSLGGGNNAAPKLIIQDGMINVINSRSTSTNNENRHAVYMPRDTLDPKQMQFSERDFTTTNEYVDGRGSVVYIWDSQNLEIKKLGNE